MLMLHAERVNTTVAFEREDRERERQTDRQTETEILPEIFKWLKIQTDKQTQTVGEIRV
jgi:hypothetical protein